MTENNEEIELQKCREELKDIENWSNGPQNAAAAGRSNDEWQDRTIEDWRMDRMLEIVRAHPILASEKALCVTPAKYHRFPQAEWITPLLYVSKERGKLELVKEVFSLCPEAVKIRSSYQGMLPLHIACKCSYDLATIAFLLEKYPQAAAVNDYCGNSCHWVPLVYAINCGRTLPGNAELHMPFETMNKLLGYDGLCPTPVPLEPLIISFIFQQRYSSHQRESLFRKCQRVGQYDLGWLYLRRHPSLEEAKCLTYLLPLLTSLQLEVNHWASCDGFLYVIDALCSNNTLRKLQLVLPLNIFDQDSTENNGRLACALQNLFNTNSTLRELRFMSPLIYGGKEDDAELHLPRDKYIQAVHNVIRDSNIRKLRFYGFGHGFVRSNLNALVKLFSLYHESLLEAIDLDDMDMPLDVVESICGDLSNPHLKQLDCKAMVDTEAKRSCLASVLQHHNTTLEWVSNRHVQKYGNCEQAKKILYFANLNKYGRARARSTQTTSDDFVRL